jgi:hypothetical protein
MDAAFEILLPISFDLKELGFKIPQFEWQGVQYPQGLPELLFGKNFHLKVSERTNISYIRNTLPPEYKNIEWQIVEVTGDGLDIYCQNLFKLAHEEIGYTLKDMLYFLLNNQLVWVVVYEPQYDGFRKVMQGSIEDIIINLKETIIEGGEGFLIYNS